MPCDDSLVVAALGQLLLGILRVDDDASPAASPGIALAIIRFTEEILTEEHQDVVDVLRQLEAAGLVQAVQAHPAPAGVHPVHITVV